MLIGGAFSSSSNMSFKNVIIHAYALSRSSLPKWTMHFKIQVSKLDNFVLFLYEYFARQGQLSILQLHQSSENLLPSVLLGIP